MWMGLAATPAGEQLGTSLAVNMRKRCCSTTRWPWGLVVEGNTYRG